VEKAGGRIVEVRTTTRFLYTFYKIAWPGSRGGELVSWQQE